MEFKKPVTIPIGPQHPALKEPELFNIILDGERIRDMTMRLGYNHRGIEKACEDRNYTQTLYLIERICGICSMTHSTCYIQAAEAVAGIDVPERALYIRSIIGELERIHSHLLWLGVAGHEVGFDTLLMYSWRDREVVMDILAELTGNRVNYGINCFGGVRRDISAEQKQDMVKKLDLLEERTKYYVQVATEETTLLQRLCGVGYLSEADVRKFGAVGPTGRASNLKIDVRADDPYAAYGRVSFDVITADTCDVFGRAVVRVLETLESVKILRQLLREMPDGPIAAKAPRKVPVGEAVSRYEAPRGEAIHYVRGNGSDKPERVKVRAPTQANLHSVAQMMIGDNLADAPLIIAAIDPCFSCTDRMIRVGGVENGKSDLMSMGELRNYGIEWYKRNRGIDFSDLNKRFKVGRD